MRRVRAPAAAAALLLAAAGEARAQELAAACAHTTTAHVVALDQFIWYNRLGANDPAAMIFALWEDVVARSAPGMVKPSPGDARLRDGKRPRPLTLRVNAGDCLEITFTNLLSRDPGHQQPHTRAASIHVMGMQLRTHIVDDGSNVGINPTSLAEVGETRVYRLFAEREGTYLLYSTGATTGGEGDGGQISRGLFGAVNVEPKGAQWYRSQLTAEDLKLATRETTKEGYPVIDYEARYPYGHPLYPRPILRMTDGSRIVHSDLNAIITGPNRGNLPADAYPAVDVGVYPERLRPFREFTAIFHDEVGLVQAFDEIFEDRTFEHTLHGGRDAFAVNYGTGGIGAEILANRFGLGPMWKCNDCKFEEFFLSSWAVGDPAMVVDEPAAVDFDPDNPPAPGPRARKALFPDDPSNVHHAYLNDHVKIRNLHAGPKEHHIFHLHAHQWLHTPNANGSSYLDSQAIGPGGGYTYEITYGGSGNRNQTPGDAIFHCHFYPHFAQGMWELYRVHDVFEAGTELEADGTVAAGARALPDGEIERGTPIPAVVPMPGYALAPLPTEEMPGFPFYIPGEAGHRPPKPPLDTRFDGGLPRHVVLGGKADFPQLNTTDFSKHDVTLDVRLLDELGEPAEQRAMEFHAQPYHPTPVADDWWNTGKFETNGLKPVPGAPYADPCGVDGVAMGTPRTVKAAGIQIRARYNKANWFFSQHRMFALWRDIAAYTSGGRAPEPLFFRAHDGDCITYHLVNLLPAEYRQDDFQVRTPTDVIGQHIHLVKFDVTSSDGAANGFNYEDGSLAPEDVIHRIEAIKRFCEEHGLDEKQCHLEPQKHPELGVLGAQETLQRWWVDPVLRGPLGTSRLGTVFSHDHFGPSTHQQAGLYAGLVPEDRGTWWRDPETGAVLGEGRDDGGPTSWRADILYADPDSSFREFNLQLADFTLAYGREGFAGATRDSVPINPPGKFEVDLPFLIRPPLAGRCPNGTPAPCPEILSADDPGTMTVNYRNEPLALRVRDPGTNDQAAGAAGDLALSFSSDRDRADDRFDTFGPYGRRPGELPGDPFTPLMRVYEDDRILVRLLVGAHEEGHVFNIRGTRWLFEPRFHRSGWRNAQMMGISEYNDLHLDPLLTNWRDTVADFAYEAGAVDNRWNGTWGIIRAYRRDQTGIDRLYRLYEHRPPSLSYEAALADASLQRRVAPDSVPETALDYPDVNDPATWEGDVAALEAREATQKSALPVTEADSLESGYGTESTGGIEYERFEYDPATGTEYVVTNDSAAAKRGDLAYQGEVALAADEPASASSATATKTASASTDDATITRGSLYTSRPDWPYKGFWGACPRLGKVRFFDVSAVSARAALPEGTLQYNARGGNGGPLHDPSAIMYVHTSDLSGGRLKDGVPREPLVLRANAGECILVRLRNQLATPLLDPDGFNTLPIIVDRFNANQVDPSERVGLRPQLVAFDVQRSDGQEVGINRNTEVLPGRWRWYLWYAGDVSVVDGRFRATPIEFGATNLMPADPIQHSNKGAIAALVVEPQGSTHRPDRHSRASATIRRADGSTFREFVLLYQDDINLQFGKDTELLQKFDCEEIETEEEKESCEATGGYVRFAAGDPVPNTAEAEDPEDSGQKAFNYRTEPMWFRRGYAPDAELGLTRRLNFQGILTDSAVGGHRPQTPIFTAATGQQVRFRVLHPGGHARNHVFNLHGHVWEELPYGKASLTLGANPLSEWKGARDLIGPASHFDLLLKNGAGGRYGIAGEYLYRDQPSFQFDGGLWGIFQVVRSRLSPSPGVLEPAQPTAAQGGCTIDPATGRTLCTEPEKE